MYKELVSKLAFGALIILASLSIRAEVVKAKDIDIPKDELMLSILKLVLSKVDTPYEFESFTGNPDNLRTVAMVAANDLSVMWGGIQQEYEEAMLPVRVPILKGMLGHRILIMREGDQHLFDHVKDIDDLRQITLGQGRQWGDTKVLKHNNLKLVDPVKFDSLMYMLEGGRYDGFPRAIHEPWSEVVAYKDLNLAVESNILIIYPFGMYYYVNKNNTKLARDIERGFELARADGSYDELFLSHPMIRNALDNANLKDRVVIRLENPFLPPETPIDNEELWLDVSKL